MMRILGNLAKSALGRWVFATLLVGSDVDHILSLSQELRSVTADLYRTEAFLPNKRGIAQGMKPW